MDRKSFEIFGSFGVLSILIVGIGLFLVYEEWLIGPAYFLLGLISFAALSFFNIERKTVYPDIIFGFVDNGILIFIAVLGGVYAGVTGAILGGAAGNTLTDGIGGVFEGRVAQKLRKRKIADQRDPLSTMLGKMIGCLFGAGVGLILVSLIKYLFSA